jgi:uncharacterized protein (TIGR02271 family)
MEDAHGNDRAMALEQESHQDREIVVPLLEEEMAVSKRVVPTGRVQVSRITREHEEMVDELLAREHVEIDRIPIERTIDAIPAIREDGDTIIIPVVEEVLTVERRLVLKAEVRIKKRREMERHQERVTLRKQEAVVTRLPVQQSGAGGGGD